MNLDPREVFGIVLAHGAARDTVIRHMPYWFKVAHRLLILVQEEDELNISDPRVTVARRVPNGGSYSTETNERVRAAMNLALETPSKYYMLFEYDSLCWGPIPSVCIPPDGLLAASVWPNEPVSPIPGKTFKARFYMHFPQLYTRKALETVVETMNTVIPISAEHGYIDRYIGLAVQEGGVQFIDCKMMGFSYTWANISRFPEKVRQCENAVKNQGVIFTHGIKDEPSLRRIAAVSPFGVLHA
jgi:hypothetical protein